MRAWKELTAFAAHLRLHYQFFILSGAFLCGAIFAGGPHGRAFFIQFINVHVLLFGGVTVYNSYWDKDTGPIGGLRAPPPLAPWTLPACWLLQGLGLLLCYRVSPVSSLVYAAAMIFFWLYSRPGIRWKGRPWLSLVAIGVSTGMCGFLLGFLHGGSIPPAVPAAAALAASAGVAFLIVSLFPMSQVYQVGEDVERNDFTFTAKYGLAGVKRVYLALFFPGVVILAASIAFVRASLGAMFLPVGILAGLLVWRQVRELKMSPDEYARVMRIKYAASGLFVAFLVAVLALQARGYFSSAPVTATSFFSP
jgi:hypothetical protein